MKIHNSRRKSWANNIEKAKKMTSKLAYLLEGMHDRQTQFEELWNTLETNPNRDGSISQELEHAIAMVLDIVFNPEPAIQIKEELDEANKRIEKLFSLIP